MKFNFSFHSIAQIPPDVKKKTDGIPVGKTSKRCAFCESAATLYQLREVIPETDWSSAHHWLIFHGRRVCSARNPKCSVCPLSAQCIYYNAQKETPHESNTASL